MNLDRGSDDAGKEIIKINRATIQPFGKTFVIAEIGVNHDGRLDRALQLVQAASDAGADAVKLQLFQADRLMHRSSQFAGYQKDSVNDSSPVEMLRRYELSCADVETIVEEIRRLGMSPLATPFSLEDVALIESLQLPAIKIASPDLVNWPLLRRAAETKLPLLISTGAATLNEISSSIAWLRGWQSSFALLHCISSYPTPVAQANLCWIAELAAKFNVPIGFSDHTTEILSGALAVAAGACIVEKHLTYDRAAQGPDHSSSFDGAQFAEYVSAIRLAETLRGRPGKRVLEIERDVRNVSRQSLVAARDLPGGHLIQEDDLTTQRPGTGIPASALPSIVGRRIGRAMSRGQMLTWNAISDAA
jgi:N-acetylneuraminate synthase/N,N'-diacetyllegionaminate synthase